MPTNSLQRHRNRLGSCSIRAGLAPPSWEPVWADFTDEYYLRHRPEEIAWHTRVPGGVGR